jgi:sialidase-1
MATAPDFAKRQQVEGFSRLVSESNRYTFGGGVLGPDYRGSSPAAMTPHWYRPAQPGEPGLCWETAPAPRAVDTTFVFAGESANLPENVFPPHQATLFVNGERVLSFDLGQRLRRLWQEGDWALEFVPKQVGTSVDGYHRQFGTHGCSGVYRLAAPARALTAGQPVQLQVAIESRSQEIAWFAVRQRTDVLDVSAHTNAEEIQRLQDEVIHLKRIVGNLARRSYAELFPERIPTEDVIIYSNGTAHVHVPDLLLLRNGDLLCAFREATEHLSNDGRIVMVRSRDGGKTWGERQVLVETPDTDERECALCQLRDGTLLANEWPNTFYDRDGYYLAVPTTHHKRQMRMYVGRSTDNGHTWTWPEPPVDPAPFMWAVSSERIIELPSGRLVMACYGGREPRKWGSSIFCSDDRGLSWRYLSTVADIPGIRLGEPALIEARSGRLICLMRNEDGEPYYQSVSEDGGQTWSPPRPSPIPGMCNPASLVVLPDGAVLCIHGARPREAAPYSSRDEFGGLYVVASYDEGETWDMAHRRVLRDDFANMDIGYPSSVLMPDGSVFVSYYFNMFGRFFMAGSFFRWEA